jgi:hypothetical protein
MKKCERVSLVQAWISNRFKSIGQNTCERVCLVQATLSHRHQVCNGTYSNLSYMETMEKWGARTRVCPVGQTPVAFHTAKDAHVHSSGDGHSQPSPTSAPRKMNDKWSGNSFLLSSSSLANHGALLNSFFFPLPTYQPPTSRLLVGR